MPHWNNGIKHFPTKLYGSFRKGKKRLHQKYVISRVPNEMKIMDVFLQAFAHFCYLINYFFGRYLISNSRGLSALSVTFFWFMFDRANILLSKIPNNDLSLNCIISDQSRTQIFQSFSKWQTVFPFVYFLKKRLNLSVFQMVNFNLSTKRGRINKKNSSSILVMISVFF